MSTGVTKNPKENAKMWYFVHVPRPPTLRKSHQSSQVRNGTISSTVQIFFSIGYGFRLNKGSNFAIFLYLALVLELSKWSWWLRMLVLASGRQWLAKIKLWVRFGRIWRILKAIECYCCTYMLIVKLRTELCGLWLSRLTPSRIFFSWAEGVVKSVGVVRRQFWHRLASLPKQQVRAIAPKLN